jgi:Methyltransferase FkbM domain
MNRRYPACNRLLAEPPASTSPDETLISVPTRELDRLLDEHLPDTRIDLLNVDCEGQDLQILQTFDFSRRKPAVIATEDAVVATDSPLSTFLQSRGYDCKAHIGLTKIFQLNGR